MSQIMYVIGCPGAGKGTLCAKLALELRWAHISVGSELRDYVQQDGQADPLVVECVQSGTLVPVAQLGEIIQHRTAQIRKQGLTSFIIDGFPRSVDQIEYMQDLLGTPGSVIYMDCPKEIARERVLTRNDMSRVDSEELFEKRFTEFSNKNPAILVYFEAQNKLIKINTSHDTDTSFGKLLATLQYDNPSTKQ